jgi:hypothetical protein
MGLHGPLQGYLYLLLLFFKSVCLYVYVAMKRMGENFTAAKKTLATTEESLDA